MDPAVVAEAEKDDFAKHAFLLPCVDRVLTLSAARSRGSRITTLSTMCVLIYLGGRAEK